MSERERDLRDALGEVRVGEEWAAEERAWRVVAAAVAAGVGAPARRVRRHRRALQAALAIGLIALIVSPAGASVRDWVAARIEPGAQRAKPVLVSLPGDGSLLVNSSQGPWIVRPDGSKRLLGDYTEASWSPHGLFAVVTKGHELAAIEPTGTVRWALTRPGRVDLARWNGPDGYRIAYLDGRELRVVDGDGSDDRLLARGLPKVAPAWRPGSEHMLAYATWRGAVVVVRADSGRRVFATSPAAAVISLQWTRQGLLVTRPDRLQLLRPSGRVAWTWTPPPGSLVWSASAAPRGGEPIAAVVHAGRTSRLVLLSPGYRSRVLFAGPGRFATPRWSPDRRWLLLPWPSADQWLFLDPAADVTRLHAVADVTAQFSPGEMAAARFPSVAGWCCSR